MRFTLLLLATLAAASAPAAEEPKGTSESVARVLRLAEQQFLSLAEAMPEKLYNFAPPGSGFEGVRTFAEQVNHVACGNYGFFTEIDHRTPPEHCEKGGPDKIATRAEILKHLRESFDYGNKVLAAMTDAAAQAKVQGPYWGGGTALTVVVAAVWHISDHYGQLVSYLRMNNIVPPATKAYPLAVR